MLKLTLKTLVVGRGEGGEVNPKNPGAGRRESLEGGGRVVENFSAKS